MQLSHKVFVKNIKKNKMIADTQKDVYRKKSVVKYYSESTGLQKPEETILDLLSDKLSGMKMLDIGVGGGRTTAYFANKVKEYVGIDFSEEMIENCKKRFLNKYTNARFLVKDVRNLSGFENGEFDIVLFSFNGLDNINNEQRETAVKDIRRICKQDGYFIFSSHNIFYIPELLKVHFRFNIIKMLQSLFKRGPFIRMNKEKIIRSNDADYVILFDGKNDFGLNTYYTKPSYQHEFMNKNGFKTIDIFDYITGKRVHVEAEKTYTKTPWFYYLCR